MNAGRVTGRAFFLASPRIALRYRRALAQAVLVESVQHRRVPTYVRVRPHMHLFIEKGSVESTHKVPTSHAKGSVESTHEVPTSHYHTKHCHAAVASFIHNTPTRKRSHHASTRHSHDHTKVQAKERILTGVLVHRVTRPLRGSVSCGSGWSVPRVSIQLTHSAEERRKALGKAGVRGPRVRGRTWPDPPAARAQPTLSRTVRRSTSNTKTGPARGRFRRATCPW